jgi:hypothetical protein
VQLGGDRVIVQYLPVCSDAGALSVPVYSIVEMDSVTISPKTSRGLPASCA